MESWTIINRFLLESAYERLLYASDFLNVEGLKLCYFISL
jgi:hypothetical protein